jgi:hypothetical protein
MFSVYPTQDFYEKYKNTRLSIFLIFNLIFLAEKCPLQCFPGFQPGLYEKYDINPSTLLHTLFRSIFKYIIPD